MNQYIEIELNGIRTIKCFTSENTNRADMQQEAREYYRSLGYVVGQYVRLY
jgi:hypothetical protein